MAYGEGTDMDKAIDTLLGKSRATYGLLERSIALTHSIVGVPLEEKSKDENHPGSSLEVLSSELGTIWERAATLLGQLERIKEKIGPSSDD